MNAHLDAVRLLDSEHLAVLLGSSDSHHLVCGVMIGVWIEGMKLTFLFRVFALAD